MTIEEIFRNKAITAKGDNSLIDISRLMKEKNVGCVVIIDENIKQPKPIGILTDRDIALQISAHEKDFEQLKAKDIMSKDVLTLKKSHTPKQALIEMRKRGVRRAPVLDNEGKLLGIIAADDLLSFCIGPLVEFEHLIKHQISQTHCAE